MWRTFFTLLTTVSLAKVGDETQMATMLFAAHRLKIVAGIGFIAVGIWTIVVK